MAPEDPLETASGVDVRGLLALLAGGAAIAFAPIGVRLADVSPTASAFWRVALAMLVLWPIAALHRPAQISSSVSHARGAMRIAGVFFAADLAVWHLAVIYTSVASATLEANFAPVFVALAGWLIFKQRFSRMFVLAIALTLGGAVLLIGPDLGRSDRALLGDALGSLTAVFYAGYMLAVTFASRTAGTLQIASMSTRIAAMLLLPYALLTADRFWPRSLAGWAVLAGLGLVAHAGGQTLIAYGLSRVPPALGSVTLLVQPLMAALYADALLGEPIGIPQLAGGAVIIAGIWLAQRSSHAPAAG